LVGGWAAAVLLPWTYSSKFLRERRGEAVVIHPETRSGFPGSTKR